MREIIVIGAARSGTKILRDTLAVGFGWGSVPYDIGYVWRAHVSSPDDGFLPTDLDDRAIRYIRGFIQKYGLGHRAVIEKTVGNALRVPAVHRVFPDALFIHLVRDGADVVESAARQWGAPTDFRYLAQKVRHFPLAQAPTYGVDYARTALQRGRSGKGLAVWGPRYNGIDADALVDPVEVVCAKQWSACVASAAAGFKSVDAQVLDVRYEDFVRSPRDVISRVSEAVGIEPDPALVGRAVERVEPPSASRGRSLLDSASGEQLGAIMNAELKRLGYAEVGVS